MAYISFQPSDFFNTKLWTGTGATHAITGVGFQPDFTWIKNTDGTKDHTLTDAVRGVDSQINTNNTSAASTNADQLTAFDSDGFTLGSDGSEGTVNNSGDTYVGWNWKMGTTSGLSGGTITPSSYSFNTTAGQSIIAYTGTGSAATVPHGLGATPGLVICKRLDGADNWWTHVKSMTGPQYMVLNGTGAVATATSVWNDTLPTSTVFSIGTDGGINASGGTFIAYCFAPKNGYSAMGSYTGNGNANGPFVYTGFRPAFILVKKVSASDWFIWDDKRSTTGKNVCDDTIMSNNNSVETSVNIDINANGFKLRDTNVDANDAGSKFIYAAFAEFPVVSSNSKAGVAR